jgi:hypothetical protein
LRGILQEISDVDFGKDYKAKRRVIVKKDETGEETEYLIRTDVSLIVVPTGSDSAFPQ